MELRFANAEVAKLDRKSDVKPEDLRHDAINRKR